MSISQKKNQKGFTLLEVLLVVALIAILAGIILVAIKPAERIRQANDAQRQADVATILNAVYQFAIDNNGSLPEGEGGTPTLSATKYHIGLGSSSCDTDCGASGQVEDGANCIDLTDDLVSDGGYLASIPINPGLGDASFSADRTGYYISTASNGTVTVASCVDGADGAIEASR